MAAAPGQAAADLVQNAVPDPYLASVHAGLPPPDPNLLGNTDGDFAHAYTCTFTAGREDACDRSCSSYGHGRDGNMPISTDVGVERSTNHILSFGQSSNEDRGITVNDNRGHLHLLQVRGIVGVESRAELRLCVPWYAIPEGARRRRIAALDKDWIAKIGAEVGAHVSICPYRDEDLGGGNGGLPHAQMLSNLLAWLECHGAGASASQGWLRVDCFKWIESLDCDVRYSLFYPRDQGHLPQDIYHVHADELAHVAEDEGEEADEDDGEDADGNGGGGNAQGNAQGVGGVVGMQVAAANQVADGNGGNAAGGGGGGNGGGGGVGAQMAAQSDLSFAQQQSPPSRSSRRKKASKPVIKVMREEEHSSCCNHHIEEEDFTSDSEYIAESPGSKRKRSGQSNSKARKKGTAAKLPDVVLPLLDNSGKLIENLAARLKSLLAERLALLEDHDTEAILSAAELVWKEVIGPDTVLPTHLSGANIRSTLDGVVLENAIWEVAFCAYKDLARIATEREKSVCADSAVTPLAKEKVVGRRFIHDNFVSDCLRKPKDAGCKTFLPGSGRFEGNKLLLELRLMVYQKLKVYFKHITVDGELAASALLLPKKGMMLCWTSKHL